ncbi:MAG: tRNA (guanine-N(7)-)-methyltransferase TrmB [Idiomarinaceae bacterium HL-53]|nr:MAG: tRNA (guanine-N(7)-)-methyltransferase TrmB [Idiomarinaceae bacterium HL-53]CUS48485.1 tRNA (guanine-N7-)-methyltransferase [Idiomarinaceae bacterium HL-53]
MTEQQKEQNSAPAEYMRRIRSFVKREGRLTKGQAVALETLWPVWGINAPASSETLNLETIFGRSAPVVLEIGFGMGQSLVAMAKAAPETNFIGIEVHRPGVGACLMEAQAQGVENLRVIEFDAVEVLEQWLPDHCLDKVQIFFPDPWHKKRHHKRRLVQTEFVTLLHQKMKTHGVLHLATDWENYAEYMLEVLNPLPLFENQSEDNTYIARPDERPLTKFEKRGQKLGHGVWDMKFTAL